MPRRKLTKRTSRRPRRKLTSTTRRRTRSVVPMSTAKQALAYIHPFMGTGNRPKIIGDNSQLSIGVSNKYVTTLDTSKIGWGPTIDLILYPGLNGGLVSNCVGSQDVPAPGTGPIWDSTYGGGYPVGHNEHGQGLKNEQSLVDGAPAEIKNNTDITSWRQVSMGAKFQLLNTDETNDGWFECVRFKMPHDFNNMAITGEDCLTGSTDSQQDFFIHPRLGYMKQELDEFMVQEPSYTRGRLKDIHEFDFNLKHFDSDHPWQMIPSRVALTHMVYNNTHNQVLNDISASVSFTDGGTLVDSLSNFNYKTMDCIYMRIHPGNSGSKLLCDVVSNQENIYHPSSDLSQFQSLEDSRYEKAYQYMTKAARSGGIIASKAGEFFRSEQFQDIAIQVGQRQFNQLMNQVIATIPNKLGNN